MTESVTTPAAGSAPTGNYFRDTRPVEPDEPRVLYRAEEHIAHVVINRPLVLNAIHADVHRGIVDGLQQADADDEVRVVILSGKGRAFSVGGDRGLSPEERAAMEPADSIDTGLAIWNCRKPVIAAVQGYALGQGAEIAAICDLTIAADDARFGEVQINMGAGPPIFSAPSVMGIKQVKEYLLTGEHFTAQHALDVGLVNRVVPRDRLMDEALVVARRLAALPPRGVQGNKKLINEAYERAGFLDSLKAAYASFGHRE
jgi:enoyl-CoA hydratase/carnithine racemase